MQLEMDQLRQELDRIAKATEFNTKTLLNGDFSKDALSFHIGANAGQNMQTTLGKMDAKTLGVAGSGDKSISIEKPKDANEAITVLDQAIEKVSEERAKYGAIQNRMEHSINNLGIASENLQAAESRIRDTDVAKEMMEFSKNKIISESGVSMLCPSKYNTSRGYEINRELKTQKLRLFNLSFWVFLPLIDMESYVKQ